MTKVIPSERIIKDEERFKISKIRPYKRPSCVISTSRKPGTNMILKITRIAKATNGKNMELDLIFCNAFIKLHLRLLLS